MENSYKTLEIVRKIPTSSVFHLFLNRPLRSNALSLDFFEEFPLALSYLDQNPDVSVIILAGAGKHFCSGIDLNSLSVISDRSVSGDRGRFGERLRRQIKSMQDAITAIERCRKPVIAAVHGACIGGGIDIVTACDIRYCSEDAFFSVKEVDLAITADLGTLQRLPTIVGHGNAMELALTARGFSGREAKDLGLVSRVFGSKSELDEGVMMTAEGIAVKSPLAVTGTKAVLLRSRELNVEQGLDYVATWNSSVLISEDLNEVVEAQMKKTQPRFSKL
ncbi:PREDICTED: delta(3,5)-Delta(2,4)-dienoyl-CoA isomerase, peroxisomal [Tarenaya hassleriana]|uniref:delta(3,5)-Delta(2,4)-dienoyl-CoA isomerase, peroxisomal n=1 Tax=Tarenaya hassleriana TaxID=28532 RepID=UPI00053C6BE7|nr:PREDICTED: delta(3,5)-Delta(2,4)-dienoyl-CoA isomerase, peroxisomal [Tarenaya hassleriana]